MSRLKLLARAALCAATLCAAVAVAPAAASARTLTFGNHHVTVPREHAPSWRGYGSFGQTTLALDPGTAAALQSLGVTPAPIAPATAGPAGLRFPITDSFPQALVTRTITHSGGISLTAGTTSVALTNFDISLGPAPTLSADVGGSRVTILNLGFAGARVRVGFGGLSLGPVTATLTPAAASALNSAFGVTAFTPGLTLGTATVQYRLF